MKARVSKVIAPPAEPQQPANDSLIAQIMSFKRALTVGDVAELLAVSPDSIYRLVNSGEIPSFRVMSNLRFEPGALAEWLRQQQIQ
jgi:excisionase family DNA binding protein